MLIFVLLAAILALAAVGTATALTIVRTIELVRRFRAFSAVLNEEVAKVSESADRVAARAEELGDRAAVLEPVLARLADSRARLSVLLAAWADVRAVVGGVTALRPRK